MLSIADYRPTDGTWWAIGCPGWHRRSESKSFKLTDRYPSFIADIWDFEQNEADGLSYERLTTESNKTVNFHCSEHGTRWIEQIKEIVKYWKKVGADVQNVLRVGEFETRLYEFLAISDV